MAAMSVEANTGSVVDAWARQMTPLRSDDERREAFGQSAEPILERHRRQTVDEVRALRRKYAKPIFGKVRVWDLIEKLGSCVDPTDRRLFCASQQMHVLQMLETMERDDAATPEMVLVALVHDLGKVLLLTGEDPANVVCMNGLVDGADDGVGLDNATIQWNHDEFAYERLRDHLPEDLAWLVRYHSVEVRAVSNVMDERDRERTRRLLVPFARYDHATKSPFYLPSKGIQQYRDVIEQAFPRRIRF
jgi:Myo-inositol oxygenase